jgi:hypothetical protein
LRTADIRLPTALSNREEGEPDRIRTANGLKLGKA